MVVSVEIAALAALTVLAGGVGTLSGFGTSTIMVPVLVMFFPLPQTLLLVGIIHWFGDVWKIALFRHGIRWPLWVAFGIPGVLFSFLGAGCRSPRPRSCSPASSVGCCWPTWASSW